MSLLPHVNASGFPLQLALADAVRRQSHRWKVLYEEHAWSHDESSGFLDLVLEDEYKSWVLTIECKRVRDSDWIFLRDSTASRERRHAKLLVSNGSGEVRRVGWFDVPMDPSSAESMYCVVPGQDAKAQPMLERVGAALIQATEALAAEETLTIARHYSTLRIYQTVVVTTASLKVCDVNVPAIDLSSGTVGNEAAFVEVPYVRFRKQLGASMYTLRAASDDHSLKAMVKERESTLFVVNAARFVDFLAECELPDRLEQFMGVR